MTTNKKTAKAKAKKIKPQSDELTRFQRQLVINIVQHNMTGRDAARAAGSKAKKDSTLDSIACDTLRIQKVKAFRDLLIEQSLTEAIMSKTEALALLSEMAKTSITDLADFSKAQVGEDADGEPVYQTVWTFKDSKELDRRRAISIQEITAGRDGLKIKMHSRLESINQLSKILGWEAPTKQLHEVTGPGNQPLMPTKDEVKDAMRDILQML